MQDGLKPRNSARKCAQIVKYPLISPIFCQYLPISAAGGRESLFGALCLDGASIGILKE